MDLQYYKKLVFAILGIYSIYLCFGLVQEKIYRYVSPSGDRFEYTSVLLLIQTIINFTIASILLNITGKENRKFSLQIPKKDLVGRAAIYRVKDKDEECIIRDVDEKSGVVLLSFSMFGKDTYNKPVKDVENIHFKKDVLSDYWIYGVCYTLAMIFSNNALKHVTYPTQVLAKSCKMIPVMLAGTLFGTRKYSVQKYISVLIMTVGIILFQLLGNKKKVSAASNSNLGLLLLVLSLCMDGICGMQQDIVVPRFKPSSLRLQVMLNVYGMMIALVASLFSQELLPGLSFLLENRVCLMYCLVYGVCSSVGQMFILFTVRHFPPLVLSTITTTRKFFSILLSVVFMGNEISWGQWIGVFLVFFGISFDKLAKRKEKRDSIVCETHTQITVNGLRRAASRSKRSPCSAVAASIRGPPSPFVPPNSFSFSFSFSVSVSVSVSSLSLALPLLPPHSLESAPLTASEPAPRPLPGDRRRSAKTRPA